MSCDVVSPAVCLETMLMRSRLMWIDGSCSHRFSGLHFHVEATTDQSLQINLRVAVLCERKRMPTGRDPPHKDGFQGGVITCAAGCTCWYVPMNHDSCHLSFLLFAIACMLNHLKYRLMGMCRQTSA